MLKPHIVLHWFSVDAIPIPVKKKKKFSKVSGFAWTGPYSDTVILDDLKFSAQRRAVFGTMFFTVRNSIATTLQRCVPLKMVVANRSV